MIRTRRAYGFGGLLLAASGVLGVALGGGGLHPAGAAEPAGEAPGDGAVLRRPETRAGPFRVALVRVSQNRRFAEELDPNAMAPRPIEVTQSVHLHLAVLAPDADAARLEIFQISDVTVGGGRRSVSLAHHVGPVEASLAGAVVQAYVYIPKLPESVRALEAVQGEVVAYQGASRVEIDMPLPDELTLPLVVEKDGIKVTLREFTAAGAIARASLRVEGPARSALVAPAGGGTFGVSLLGEQGKEALPAESKLLQPRSNQLDYQLGFQRLQGRPGKLQLLLLHRIGPRRAYPFRLENVPLPYRTPDGRLETGGGVASGEKQ